LGKKKEKKHVKKKQKQNKKKPAVTVNIPRVLEYSIIKMTSTRACDMYMRYRYRGLIKKY
jgi:hypothetical protein